MSSFTLCQQAIFASFGKRKRNKAEFASPSKQRQFRNSRAMATDLQSHLAEMTRRKKCKVVPYIASKRKPPVPEAWLKERGANYAGTASGASDIARDVSAFNLLARMICLFETPWILGNNGVCYSGVFQSRNIKTKEQQESITEGRVIPLQLLLSVHILLVLLLLPFLLLAAFGLRTRDVVFFSIFAFFFLFLLFLFTAVLILVSLLRQKSGVGITLAKILF